MSHTANTNLMDEANFYADYFTGTMIEKLLCEAMESKDMELLAIRVAEARDEAYKLEYNPEETEAADVE